MLIAHDSLNLSFIYHTKSDYLGISQGYKTFYTLTESFFLSIFVTKK